jgi:hypothetical protein
MIGSHNGLGRGLGINTSAIDEVPAGIARQKKDPAPPCCGSLFRHLPGCKLANKAAAEFIAALPVDMPNGIEVHAAADIQRVNIFASDVEVVAPAHARAFARALLLAADEAERLSGGGNG